MKESRYNFFSSGKKIFHDLTEKIYIHVHTGCFKIKYTILNEHNFHSIIDTNFKQKPFEKGGLKFII